MSGCFEISTFRGRTFPRKALLRPPRAYLSALEFLADKIRATKTNADFFDSMRRG
jgi:transcription termination factor Rho